MANDKMRDYWDGEQADAWVRAHGGYEAMLEPFVAPILDAAGLRTGDAVFDVGCGSGALARAAAERVGPTGRVTGLDISARMISLASRLGPDTIRYRACDVQTADLRSLGADAAVSRFGIMFFEDARAGLANIGSGVGPGGRIAFACWRSPLDNDWIRTPMSAVVPVLGAPNVPDPGAPGPFQMADAAFVRAALEDSGWRDVEIGPHDCLICVGGAKHLDEAVAFLTRDGMGRQLFEGKPAAVRARAEEALRAALAPHATTDGVRLGAAAWLVTATRP